MKLNLYRKTLVSMAFKIVFFAMHWMTCSQALDICNAINIEEYAKHDARSNKNLSDFAIYAVWITTKGLYASKIVLMIGYIKYPWLMRCVSLIDALILVSVSVMPVDNFELKLYIACVMSVLDFVTNYCGDLIFQVIT